MDGDHWINKVSDHQQRQEMTNRDTIKIDSKNLVPIQNVFATKPNDNLPSVALQSRLARDTYIPANGSIVIKRIQVFVEQGIEFSIDIYNEDFTCGWL
mmetsp:Transcript_5404/g.8368  ORF Transcript_5404/g.8368 Transcript_5404/m.8368 type:complete len:98 (+) Transcript_5404:434-727(+)